MLEKYFRNSSIMFRRGQGLILYRFLSREINTWTWWSRSLIAVVGVKGRRISRSFLVQATKKTNK
jgi:hypothetical protein